MIVTISDGGFVDFEAPVHMTDKQKGKFIKSLKELFPNNIVLVNVAEPPVYVGQHEARQKKWKTEEYCFLLGAEDNKTLAKKMERTEMSVGMQRGQFISEFMIWAKKKGYKLPASKETVRKFLKEREVL